MRPIIAHKLAWSVCLSVCLSVTIVSPVKADEPIEVYSLAGLGPWNYVLDGVHIGATWRIRLNHPCAAAMLPFCQVTLSSCYHNYYR